MASDNESGASVPENPIDGSPTRPPVPPIRPEDYRIPGEPQPSADEGESIPWTADPDAHLSDVEPVEPPVVEVSGPLPVCDYTGENDEPCEEPVAERRWSSAAVITSASIGALVGGLLVSAVLVWALGLVPGTRPLATVGEQPVEQQAKQVTIKPGAAVADVSQAVAEKVLPSVVNVAIQQQAFNPFTGEQVEQEAGNGSGVIIREDGYILTNNHVIEGADRIIVTVGVEDKEAQVVGTDPSSDLAVLKIEGSGYPAAQIGSSKDLGVGQYVMAVGSPFGFERTVTVGIVSALNRSELIQGSNDLTTYTNLIQTDAAINPGNSGGALVNEQGHLVGINTLIQSTSGSSAGIGFAIPVDFAVDIADQLIASGSATHPYMGVSTESVTRSIAEQFGLPVQRGALVRFVQPQSPAEAAGLERGDIIVRIDERDIAGVEDVFAATREREIGTQVEVEVVRGDTRRTFEVTLGSDADRR
jgi:putative serine protease PepD